MSGLLYLTGVGMSPVRISDASWNSAAAAICPQGGRALARERDPGKAASAFARLKADVAHRQVRQSGEQGTAQRMAVVAGRQPDMARDAGKGGIFRIQSSPHGKEGDIPQRRILQEMGGQPEGAAALRRGKRQAVFRRAGPQGKFPDHVRLQTVAGAGLPAAENAGGRAVTCVRHPLREELL